MKYQNEIDTRNKRLMRQIANNGAHNKRTTPKECNLQNQQQA